MGPEFAVSVKINCNDYAGEGGVGPEDIGWVCKRLEGIVDFVELSGGTPFGEYGMIRPGVFHKEPEKQVWYYEELKIIAQMTTMPLSVVGGIRTPGGALRALEGGATLVGLGRPFIRHADIVKHWLEGRELSPCISCNQCITRRPPGKPSRCWVKYEPGDLIVMRMTQRHQTTVK
eukprot:gnl/Chilomastix_caulleri/1499.p1 GENE.gnl/Chilomastix_caulleri/1499~~gnl/Chilomastix_caulleri/1499.p1  ORF type:complete len:175 (+),score=32.58 gnl/Chilomastix_caulleri/1499:60-584(+)